ncbi:MAG: hypothetical protein AB9869_00995 [Verrucomicrobiia bacterium]
MARIWEAGQSIFQLQHRRPHLLWMTGMLDFQNEGPFFFARCHANQAIQFSGAAVCRPHITFDIKHFKKRHARQKLLQTGYHLGDFLCLVHYLGVVHFGVNMAFLMN